MNEWVDGGKEEKEEREDPGDGEGVYISLGPSVGAREMSGGGEREGLEGRWGGASAMPGSSIPLSSCSDPPGPIPNSRSLSLSSFLSISTRDSPLIRSGGLGVCVFLVLGPRVRARARARAEMGERRSKCGDTTHPPSYGGVYRAARQLETQ